MSRACYSPGRADTSCSTDITRGDVPDILTVGDVDYQLYQDTHVRRTVVDGGLDVPWANPEAHQIAFERRKDRIHQLVRSVAVEVSSIVRDHIRC